MENFRVACACVSEIWPLWMTANWQELSKSNGPCKAGPVHQCRLQRLRWLAARICYSLIKACGEQAIALAIWFQTKAATSNCCAPWKLLCTTSWLLVCLLWKEVNWRSSWARAVWRIVTAAPLYAPCGLRRNIQDKNSAERLHLCSKSKAQLS